MIDEWPMMDELRYQESRVADAWPMTDELRYEVNRLGSRERGIGVVPGGLHVGNDRRVANEWPMTVSSKHSGR